MSATEEGGALPPSIETARAVVRSLVDGGVRLVVLAPGSRSAPFVPVLASAERKGLLDLRVVLDERSAGFIALGAARAALDEGCRAPAAVITTSGTAVANLHPAVLEADAAGVPLVVVSADRPHELVGTGANQTTEQTRLFGSALRHVVDLPADLPRDVGAAAAERAVTGLVRRAVEAARGSLTDDPGPVQLNVRLRPPLALPAGSDGALPPLRSGPADPGSGAVAAPVPVTMAGSSPAVPGPAIEVLGVSGVRTDGSAPGIVVAGDADAATGRLAQELAERLAWPLLAEPTSGARAGEHALTRYAELLASPAGRALADEAGRVLVLGHPSLTRPVTALLSRTELAADVVTTRARWTDVAGTADRIVRVRMGAAPGLAAELARVLGLTPAAPDWADRWRAAVDALPQAEVTGAGADALSADVAAVAVWEASLTEDAPLLVVGSSMAVRRLDRLAPPAPGRAPRALANRGLAGIDGTLATATGAHLASGRPVRAVVGDLTFLHDAMSLGRGALESEPDLQVAVLDDAGGAIFSTLEYPRATTPEVLARCFGTPQAADIGALAAALGARVERPASLAELRAVLAAPVRGLSVLHVRLGGPSL